MVDLVILESFQICYYCNLLVVTAVNGDDKPVAECTSCTVSDIVWLPWNQTFS